MGAYCYSYSMEKSNLTPDYAYDNDLEVEIHNDESYLDVFRIDNGQNLVTGDNPLTTPRRVEEVHDILNNPYGITHNYDGRKLNGSIAILEPKNPTDDTETRIVFQGWGTHIGSKMVAGTIAAQSALSPDTRFALISTPGIDQKSSSLPRSVIKEMKATGSFMPAGEIFARTFDNIIKSEGWDNLDIEGISLGGRLAIASAANMDESINQVITIDPPGTRQHPIHKGQMMPQFVQEIGHAAKYAKNVDDKESAEAARDYSSLIKLVGNIAQRNIVQFVGDFPPIMAQDGLENDISKLTKRKDSPQSILFVSPNKSELNRTEDVLRIQREIGGFTVACVIDHSHLFMMSNPVIYAKLMDHLKNY